MKLTKPVSPEGLRARRPWQQKATTQAERTNGYLNPIKKPPTSYPEVSGFYINKKINPILHTIRCNSGLEILFFYSGTFINSSISLKLTIVFSSITSFIESSE